MNGRYKRGHEHQGRVHYQQTKGKFVIRWSPVKGNWLLDWRGLNTDTTCPAVLLEDCHSPHLAKTRWRVFNGKDWVIDTKMKIENATECLKKPSPHPPSPQKSMLEVVPVKLGFKILLNTLLTCGIVSAFTGHHICQNYFLSSSMLSMFLS